ncbi:FlgD immunoglobulin-like domain containing protein [Calditrichota bacterium]
MYKQKELWKFFSREKDKNVKLLPNINRDKKYVYITPLLYIFSFLTIITSFAQSPLIATAWSPNTEPQLSHYIMYRDTLPGTMVMLDIIPKTDTTFYDNSVSAGETYYYKLTAVDTLGYETEPSNEIFATAGVITTNGQADGSVIRNFQLKQNYPNPFNPTTTIEYSLPNNSWVKIVIFDVLGKEVNKLIDSYQSEGNYQVVWDGRNAAGELMASGNYFYQMTAENYADVKKLILQK